MGDGEGAHKWLPGERARVKPREVREVAFSRSFSRMITLFPAYARNSEK